MVHDNMKFVEICPKFPSVFKGHLKYYTERLTEHFLLWPLISLQEEGWEPILYSMTKYRGDVQEEFFHEIRIKRFNRIHQLLLNLHREKADLVHGHSPFGPSILSSFFSSRCLWTPHTAGPWFYEKLYGTIYFSKSVRKNIKKLIERYAYPIALHKMKQIIALTNIEKRQFIDFMGIDEEKIAVIPNPIDYDFFSNPHGGEDVRSKIDGRVIISVANLRSVKSPETLIRALFLVKKEIKNIKLVFVGANPVEYSPASGQKQNILLQELIAKFGLSRDVIFAGWQSKENLIKYLDAADLFALSSLREGLPLAACEAAASGLPLVLSDIGTLREIFSSCALFHAPMNHKKLAENIITILQDNNLYNSLAMNGKNIMKNYDAKAIKPKMLRLYQEIIESQ